MKLKTAVTAILLLFVAASVVYVVAKEVRGQPAAGGRTPPGSLSPTQTLEPPARPRDGQTEREVIAYYFHGNMRCRTCRAIEAFTTEAIETDFSDALEDGRLQWRVVNVEEPGNEHFVRDFELTTRSVVLEEIVNGERRRWKNLDRVWELAGSRSTFLKYIQDETHAYLEART